MSRVVFDQNSMFLEVLGLSDALIISGDPGFYISTAVITAEIVDEDDTQIWTDTLSYISSPSTEVIRNDVTYPDGNYRATLPETIPWSTKLAGSRTVYHHHVAKVTADDGTNRDGYWEELVKVQLRDFGDN